jgi:hypothetical protein
MWPSGSASHRGPAPLQASATVSRNQDVDTRMQAPPAMRMHAEEFRGFPPRRGLSDSPLCDECAIRPARARAGLDGLGATAYRLFSHFWPNPQPPPRPRPSHLEPQPQPPPSKPPTSATSAATPATKASPTPEATPATAQAATTARKQPRQPPQATTSAAANPGSLPVTPAATPASPKASATPATSATKVTSHSRIHHEAACDSSSCHLRQGTRRTAATLRFASRGLQGPRPTRPAG